MIDVDKAIATTVKTGKVQFGANKAVENAKSRRVKLIVLASNCPRSLVDDVMRFSRFSDVPVVIYKGTSIDLGAACGKPFTVSALSVREPGDSDILRLGEEEKGEEVVGEAEEAEEETAEETDA